MPEAGRMKAFRDFAFRVVVVHTLTYFGFGLIMSQMFHYGEVFQRDIIRDFMRPIDSPYVLAGPFLQPIRGLLFAFALWPLRELLFERKAGWLILWNMLVLVGIFSTPAAAPCSVEGMLYTKLPLWYHLLGLPEILLQTLTFSMLLVWWQRRSQRGAGMRSAPSSPLPAEILKSTMTACFAYAGYAIGGLLSVALVTATSEPGAGPKVDIRAAGSDLRIQMMFVVAFLVNLITVFVVARRRQAGRFPLWLVFVLFWVIDTCVPWLYQVFVTSPAPAHLALLLGFFPAVIITICIRFWGKAATSAGSV